MRKLSLIMLCIAATMLSNCTSDTTYGKCVGIADEKDPNLRYRVSIWNTVLSVVFIETIIVPVWVLVDETMCPVGLNNEKAPGFYEQH